MTGQICPDVTAVVHHAANKRTKIGQQFDRDEILESLNDKSQQLLQEIIPLKLINKHKTIDHNFVYLNISMI